MQPTEAVDSDHHEIVRLARELTRAGRDDRQKASRIHDFVRDEIRFGFRPAFYEMRASEVLDAGVGYCMTKGTLFVALLRAAGIPSRPRFVDLTSEILGGIVDPRTPYVDHAITEVWLGERWVRTDSYVVDMPLFLAARSRLVEESRRIGYGVHVHGTARWNGRCDAFSQFVNDGSSHGFTTRDHGVHSDAMAFYRDVPRTWNRRGLVLRTLGGLLFPMATRAADRIRRLEESPSSARVRTAR